MRVIIERSALLKALGHVTSVVERRNTIPILANVLIETGKGVIRLRATDLDIEVIETVKAEVATAGRTTVQALMIFDIVRKLPDGSQVELAREDDGARLSVTSGPARFSLQVLPPDDFPDLSKEDTTHCFSMPAKDLRRLIEKSRFAISTEETRYYLNGIYLHESDGKPKALRAVATDGHRLAQVDVALPKGAKGMPGVIVPRKTVAELHKLAEESADEVEISLSAAKIRFVIGDMVLTSKLIDGTFPDYQRVIPQGNDKLLQVSNAQFASAVDRVSTLSSDKGRAVKLQIDEGKLTLSVNNPDSGSATEELPVDYDNDAIEIGFNARYLLDISNQLESDTARFMLSDPGSPTMVRDDEDESALYVLMPMRV
ncbi:MAG: DNA polymerase III subunit beta [Pseudomonadota bacterium]|nr:DNA polymerase III subunit beta [Pseudomonadota bacterium]